MGTLFLHDDDDDGLDCPKCDAVVGTEQELKKHDTARHGMAVTDDAGRCKMCGDPVDEVGQHLRDECEPRG